MAKGGMANKDKITERVLRVTHTHMRMMREREGHRDTHTRKMRERERGTQTHTDDLR